MTKKILSFGEILWDVIDKQEYIGGAPFNLAAHLSQLQCSSFLISAVGKDVRGQNALREAKKVGVETELIQEKADYPTGWVEVKFSAEEEPVYEIHENVSYDYITYNEEIQKKLVSNEFDFFCFGTLAQRNSVSSRTLCQILDSISVTRIFCDINLRQNYYTKEILQQALAKTDILKLNQEEVKVLNKLFLSVEASQEKLIAYLLEKFSLEVVCVTLGSQGCQVYTESRKKLLPGVKVSTVDTVGAGDAFSAGFIYYFLETGDYFRAAEFGNFLGGLTASCRSAVPVYEYKEVIDQFNNY